MASVNVEIRKKDFGRQRCFNCPGNSDPRYAITYEMQRVDYDILATVHLPRCAHCAGRERFILRLSAVVGLLPAFLCVAYMWGNSGLWGMVALFIVIWSCTGFLFYMLMSLFSGTRRKIREYDVVMMMRRQGWKYYDDETGVKAMNIISPQLVEQMLDEIRDKCGCEITFK